MKNQLPGATVWFGLIVLASLTGCRTARNQVATLPSTGTPAVSEAVDVVDSPEPLSADPTARPVSQTVSKPSPFATGDTSRPTRFDDLLNDWPSGDDRLNDALPGTSLRSFPATRTRSFGSRTGGG